MCLLPKPHAGCVVLENSAKEYLLFMAIYTNGCWRNLIGQRCISSIPAVLIIPIMTLAAVFFFCNHRVLSWWSPVAQFWEAITSLLLEICVDSGQFITSQLAWNADVWCQRRKGGGGTFGGENGRLSDVKTLEVRHQNTTQRFIMLWQEGFRILHSPYSLCSLIRTISSSRPYIHHDNRHGLYCMFHSWCLDQARIPQSSSPHRSLVLPQRVAPPSAFLH